ncbi:hypothetical protein GHK92_03640 [Nocardioides sp. dk4132]|uniref:DUF6226 family protein n=1 Tax=unclassified Nocardioides TaxID=2615069 RepID=UPI0012950F4D|nr:MULTISPECIES: DUF6226 family protein [unclassified Nocardioides]MQW74955.1 hypothetical protein [Nocardioides sp. dk4132]QGA07860.1 hypothetical protein GFH29_10970 [Nocardioides sp. dk884]
MDRSSLPTTPTWASDLLAAVDRAFAVIGADTPGWPDPHGDREPDEAEYSRYTDPGKYRILVRRVEAWVEVLADRGLATTSVGPPTGATWLGGRRSTDQIVRVYRIAPRVPGGSELLCGVVTIDGDEFGLDVGVRAADASPASAAPVTSIPYCGCDACDDGSEMLLEELDRCFVALAHGDPVISP